MDDLTVFALTPSFEMFDAASGTKLAKNLTLFITQFGRYQSEDRSPDHFLRGVAKYPRGGSIPTHNEAIQIFAYNRIVRGIHDCG